MSEPPTATLRSASGRAEDWLFGQAMPLWLVHGVDWKRGGFHEALDPETLECPDGFKRLRVTARQIYVFSVGARRGVTRAAEAAEHGLRFLLTRMRHPEGGFASRCDPDGETIDGTRDLYDHAFTLFALAHAYRLSRRDTLKAEALALLAFIRREMRHQAGGYIESIPAAAPRRQNPHMHLLEAALACTEHMPDPAFASLCDELADLARRHFIDAGRGLLFEYYSDDLVPCRADGRALVEPGHHMEWAWLLTELERVTGRGMGGGPALARFAIDHGRDGTTGLLRGGLFEDGEVAQASVRLWPHGEWLKAALALDGAAGDPLAAWAALSRFLETGTAGLFREHWDARTRTFRNTPVPASSLYHITTAVVELGRYAGGARGWTHR